MMLLPLLMVTVSGILLVGVTRAFIRTVTNMAIVAAFAAILCVFMAYHTQYILIGMYIGALIPVLYANDRFGYGIMGILVGLPLIGLLHWVLALVHQKRSSAHALLDAPVNLQTETRLPIPLRGCPSIRCTMRIDDLRGRADASILSFGDLYNLSFNGITGALHIRVQNNLVWKIAHFPLQTEVRLRIECRSNGGLDIYQGDRLIFSGFLDHPPTQNRIVPFLLVGENRGAVGQMLVLEVW